MALIRLTLKSTDTGFIVARMFHKYPVKQEVHENKSPTSSYISLSIDAHSNSSYISILWLKDKCEFCSL